MCLSAERSLKQAAFLELNDSLPDSLDTSKHSSSFQSDSNVRSLTVFV